MRLCVLGRLAEELELRLTELELRLTELELRAAELELREAVLPEVRTVLPELELRVAADALRAAEEEERTAPVPETWPAEVRATLLAEERAVRAAVLVPLAERVAAEGLEATPVELRPETDAVLLVAVLLLRLPAMLCVERPPMASVLRGWVRLLVPK